MNRLILDTETVSVNKPFAYNIGYVIANNDGIMIARDFIVSEIWNNKPLFETAYYADKRPLYIAAMKAKKAIKMSYRAIMAQLAIDIATYNITSIYAYNCDFDERVLDYNCNWYHCQDPTDSLPYFDIRGYAHKCFCQTKEYIDFCEDNQFFTEGGAISSTAEAVYRFITDDTEFIEAHTALADSVIEWEILDRCLAMGAQDETAYKPARTIPRSAPQIMVIKTPNGDKIEINITNFRKNAKDNVINVTQI